MIDRLSRVLLLSAALVVGGVVVPPLALSGFAAAAAETSGKMSATQLLQKQGIAVTVMSKAYVALPPPARGKSAPFLKAMIDTAKAYREVGLAANAKDNRKMGAALPKVATSLSKLNSAYALSGLRDPQIDVAVKSLNALWGKYVKVVQVAKPPRSAQSARANTRRINAMKHRMAGPVKGRGDPRANAARAHMLALINAADRASRQADQEWYAAMLMAEAYGYYAGAYEYYLAYEPDIAAGYAENWTVISQETEYFYSESISSYEEYSWSSYEETVVVEESYEFGMTTEEYSSIEADYESSSIESSAEQLYQTSDERQTLDSVDSTVMSEDAAAEAAPAADDAVDETAVPADGAVDETAVPADGAVDETAVPADGAVDEPAPDAPEPDAVAPGTEDENAAEPQAAPDDGSAGADEALPDDGSGNQDALPEDGSGGADVCAGDNPPDSCAAIGVDGIQDEAVPEDDGAGQDEAVPEDDGASQDDSQLQEAPAQAEDAAAGDVCASDNPPADCFGAAVEEAPAEAEPESYDDGAAEEAAPDESYDDSGSGGDDGGEVVEEE